VNVARSPERRSAVTASAATQVDALFPLFENHAAMRRPPLRLCVLALAAGCVWGRAPAPAASGPPTIYKWVDANGIAHYATDLSRVPRSVRGSVRALGAAPPSDDLAARDAARTPAPPAEAPPEWDAGDAPAPPPRATSAVAGADPWAATDRPADLPPDESAPAPTQTAAVSGTENAAPELSAQDRANQLRDLDARITALQSEIASDEDALKGFLAAPAPEDPAEIAYDSSFREVAERLPKRLAELRSLQGERAQLDQP
jgi:hypothetical protein